MSDEKAFGTHQTKDEAEISSAEKSLKKKHDIANPYPRRNPYCDKLKEG